MAHHTRIRIHRFTYESCSC